MPKRIVVLGIMRSGTSLTAELVRQWGAYAGPEDDLWKSDIDDPRGYGYLEYKPLQDLNDELLNNNDRLPVPHELLEERATEPYFNKKAQQLLQEMDEQAAKNQFDAWVWKDARLPLTLPFWSRFWEDPIYVITVRHPADVVLSAARTEEINEESLPFSAGLTYWQYCMLNILSFTESNKHKIFIAYENLVNNPSQECSILCSFLDEHCGTPCGSKQRVSKMLSKVEKDQRHHQYEKSLAEMEQATREQRALYNFLRVKTLYPNETYQKEDFSLYPGWKEYLQAMDMLLSLSKFEESDNVA